jgi:hypothetical protein
VLRAGKGRGSVVLRLHRCQPGSAILFGLQMRFRSCNGRLRSGVIGRANPCRAGRGSRHDGLPSIAHFLHRWPRAAAEQTEGTDQDNNEPRHRMPRH